MEGALDKSEFMEVFYTSCIENLIAPVGGIEQDQQQQQQQGAASGKGGSSSAAQQPGGAAAAAAAPSAAAATAAGKAGSGGGGSSSAGGGRSRSAVRPVPASTIGLIVDLLCFCVQHHAFWAKYHVLR